MSDFYGLIKNIYENGKEVRPRGYLTKELIGTKLVIYDYNLFATPEHRSIESVFDYLYNETCWYLSGDCNPEKIIPHAKMWGDIRNEDGNINSNYGHRVFYRKNSRGLSGFDFALTCLQNDRESRNAIIIYNEPDLCYPGNKDFICSQHQHFMIRDNELICLVSLRSSDSVFGLYYNCPWWSLVHQQMFNSLKMLYRDLRLGKIEVTINSSHIYERHFGLVEKILSSPKEKYFIKWHSLIPLGRPFDYYKENLKSYFTLNKIS